MDRYYHKSGVPKNILRRGASLNHARLFGFIELQKGQDRLEELEGRRLEGFTPDFEGLRAVHKHIFQDIFEWGGLTRAEQVTIAGETFTPKLLETWTRRDSDGNIVAYFQGSKDLMHEAPLQIDRHAEKFDAAKESGLLTAKMFAELAADTVEDINYQHPFADGNGRAMRSFVVQLGWLYGYQVDFSDVTKEGWISACISSAEANVEPMIALLEDITRKL